METAPTQTGSAPTKVSPLPPGPTAKPAAPPKRAFLILGAVMGVALAGLGLYLFLTRYDQDTDDAQVDADVIPVAPRVSGAVIKVQARDNAKVKAGEVLFAIDPADYLARAKQAEADLALAKAQALSAHAQQQIVEAQATGGLSTAKAALSGSSVAVSAADAQVQVAIANQRKAEQDYHRAQALLADHAVAQDRFDAAQAAYDAANAQLAQAREAKNQAVMRVAEAKGRFDTARPIEAQIAAAQAQAQAADARVQSNEAALDLARLQLGYTEVRASVDGTVSRVKLQPGDLLAAGQTVMELVPEAIYVEANFKETQIGSLKPGQPAIISVDALGGRKLKGKVESLSGGTGARFSLLPPDNASGNFVKVVQRVPVRISFVDLPKDLTLQAGLSVDVSVHTD